ncbi:hypothetical protein D9758_007323 [Tetrapyrgos nigripes]|uniref:tRNA (cytosine(38)-C(5))-methyltransferase n=1 Tax=Tetrapyrgos nigripes TaxID=182062 RepID=A0A8H5GB45_9AGAR|nr:hypothetical protein D9758_007323 [Tetrapyrgos nigripes]
MTSHPKVIRALEFYSGIGGLHLALKRSIVPASVLQAFDWDQNACQVYDANHGRHIAKKVRPRNFDPTDISSLSADFLAAYGANLWILSPACQPYTVLNPNAKGALDPRAKSFLHLVQTVLPRLAEMKAHPTHLFVENVAGFESSSTREILLSVLQSLDYNTAEFLLTPLQFGIPNSRLRYYLLAKLPPFTFPDSQSGDEQETKSPGPYHYIPSSSTANNTSRPWVDPRLISPDGVAENEHETSLEAIHSLQQYLDPNLDDAHGSLPSPYAIPDKVLEKWGRLFDIVLPSSKRSCCFTRGYTRLVERAGSIIQRNEELDTTSTFDTFLKAQAENHPNAVTILHPLRLRYFSPSELLRLFAFDQSFPNGSGSVFSHDQDQVQSQLKSHCQCQRSQTWSRADAQTIEKEFEFVWPKDTSLKTKYRLIGNSVNVKVVTELINFLYEDWEDGRRMEGES